MANMNACDWLTHSMTDAECALADAMDNIGPAEPPMFRRSQAVLVVAWLRDHGWALTPAPAHYAESADPQKDPVHGQP